MENKNISIIIGASIVFAGAVKTLSDTSMGSSSRDLVSIAIEGNTAKVVDKRFGEFQAVRHDKNYIIKQEYGRIAPIVYFTTSEIDGKNWAICYNNSGNSFTNLVQTSAPGSKVRVYEYSPRK